MPFSVGSSPKKRIHVAAAVIMSEQGRILLSKRQAHQHLAGFWEFPGGKCESDETVQQALSRELKEELGITVRECRPLIQVPYDYPDKCVLLDVWVVSQFLGDALGCEGQQIEWFDKAQLTATMFPPANVPILNALVLPQHYFITPDFSSVDDVVPWCEQWNKFFYLKRVASDELVFLQLRQSLPECIEVLIEYFSGEFPSLKLILNSRYLDEFGKSELISGVHLRSCDIANQELDLLLDGVINTGQSKKWLSASCHSHDELERALSKGVDFVCISPVLPTSSHSDAKPLGWRAFRALVSYSSVPCYALGGVSDLQLQEALDAGAQGVAGIRMGSNA